MNSSNILSKTSSTESISLDLKNLSFKDFISSDEELNSSSDEKSSNDFIFAYSLFDNYSSTNVKDVWSHMSKNFNFSFKQISNLNLDSYEFISLINYLRHIQVKKGFDSALLEWKEISKNPILWKEDCLNNLNLPIVDDRLLWDQPEEIFNQYFQETIDHNSTMNFSKAASDQSYKNSLQEENLALKNQVSTLQKLLCLASNEKSEIKEKKIICSWEEKQLEHDNSYFNSYSNFNIHREMLLDDVRTNTYGEFILNNKDFFNGKVVLDVGCGSSILSLFACKAGASVVVAVDASEKIVKLANCIIEKNNMHSSIKTFASKVEDLKLYTLIQDNTVILTEDQISNYNPDDLVPFCCDIIISEWMGYSLLFESMLNSVIIARDKFLKSDGLIFPNVVLIGAYGLDYKEIIMDKIKPWSSMYGFDLSPIEPSFHELLHFPEIVLTSTSQIRTPMIPACALNINCITNDDLSNIQFPIFLSPTLSITSIGIYFDCFFTLKRNFFQDIPAILNLCNENSNNQSQLIDMLYENSLVLKTGPFEKPTHWKQTLLHLLNEDGMVYYQPDFLKIIMSFLSHEQNSRALRIIFEIFSPMKNRNWINSFELH